MGDLLRLSGCQTVRIASFFPLAPGVPRVDDRRVESDVVDVIRNGLQWKDCALLLLRQLHRHDRHLPALIREACA